MITPPASPFVQPEGQRKSERSKIRKKVPSVQTNRPTPKANQPAAGGYAEELANLKRVRARACKPSCCVPCPFVARCPLRTPKRGKPIREQIGQQKKTCKNVLSLRHLSAEDSGALPHRRVRGKVLRFWGNDLSFRRSFAESVQESCTVRYGTSVFFELLELFVCLVFAPQIAINHSKTGVCRNRKKLRERSSGFLLTQSQSVV